MSTSLSRFLKNPKHQAAYVRLNDALRPSAGPLLVGALILGIGGGGYLGQESKAATIGSTSGHVQIAQIEKQSPTDLTAHEKTLIEDAAAGNSSKLDGAGLWNLQVAADRAANAIIEFDRDELQDAMLNPGTMDADTLSKKVDELLTDNKVREVVHALRQQSVLGDVKTARDLDLQLDLLHDMARELGDISSLTAHGNFAQTGPSYDRLLNAITTYDKVYGARYIDSPTHGVVKIKGTFEQSLSEQSRAFIANLPLDPDANMTAEPK